MTFENSFSPFPLCCPARASPLTGQLSHNHDVYWHRSLRQVHAEVVDCQGDGCLVPIPEGLAAGAEESRATTRQWLADHDHRYGWR